MGAAYLWPRIKDMSIMRFYGFMLLFAGCVTGIQAQDLLRRQFQKQADAFIQSLYDSVGSMAGMTVVVVKGDETVYQQSIGYANREKRVAVTPHTAFYIASSTKSFTGLLAAMLDERGIIRLDDPLVKYFPEVEFDPSLSVEQVRIRDLLTHTAGLENEGITFRTAFSGEHTPSDLIGILSHTRAREGGYGTFSYTNLGYNIYAMILEKVTGRPWQDWLEEEIFQPLGMDHTTAYMSKAEKNDWQLALPYAGLAPDDIRRLYLRKKDNTMQAAGGLITTGSDMARWLRLQLGRGMLSGERLISEAMIRKTWKDCVSIESGEGMFSGSAYGLGWERSDYAGHVVLHHFGGFPGYRSHMSFMPDAQLGIAVLVNEGLSGFRVMNAVAAFAYDWWLGVPDVPGRESDRAREVVAEIRGIRERVRQHYRDLASREWNLSLPFAAFSGTFTNDLLGTVHIQGSQSGIEARMGNLHCEATPYTEAETIRVEWVPGRGEVIRFELDNGAVEGLYYSGNYFAIQSGR